MMIEKILVQNKIFLMNKLKRQAIASLICSAEDRCAKAFMSYKPYGASYNHEAALSYLDEAQRSITEAREKILLEVQPNTVIPPQLNKHDVSGRSEQLCVLLQKLKEGNMCSVAGDELIDEFLQTHNCH